MKTFETFGDLAYDMALTVQAAVQRDMSGASASVSGSRISESAYVEVHFLDDDGDYRINDDGRDAVKIRFSAHGDRYGSDITIRIDDRVEVVKDGDGKYVETRISDEDHSALVNKAIEATQNFRATVE